MTLAEEFEESAFELRHATLTGAPEIMRKAAERLDRAAELARDQERVVQSIVRREGL